MRSIHLVAAAAICGAAMGGVCLAQAPAAPPADKAANRPAPAPPAPDQIWLVGTDDILFRPVPIAFPLKAGILTATKHDEASHAGENIDNAIEYHSSNQGVWATVYIYYPGLPHAGIAAIAQDWAIRDQSPTATGGDIDLGPAGAVNGAAVRTSYIHYKGNLASDAAFLKVGRWIVTIRVSGPEARKADVDAATQALLDHIRFGQSEPVRIEPRLTLTDCAAAGDQPPARIVPDPRDAAIAAKGVLATFDGGGAAAKDGNGNPTVLPSRVPIELCRARLKVKDRSYTLLRAADGDPISVDGRSVRLVLLSDSGRILEVDHAPKLGGYVLLFHDLAETDVLGTYDSIPSDAQLAAILDGTDREGGRIHIPAKFRPGHGVEITLPQTAPAEGQKAASAQPPVTSSR
ncbi:MAG TPA: hypothetical protein VFW19_15815 [Allosphingosinicella sp.]|nr:hypothetical protein [Allosphingosinicella sp.]